MKLGLCQLGVKADKAYNIAHAEEMLERAHALGADMAILPEMFVAEYIPKQLPLFAEACPGGPAGEMLSRVAKRTGMTIVGGSVPESDGGKMYNTSCAYDASGAFIGKYRKAHLFDVDIPGCRVQESESFAPGDNYPLILEKPIRTGVAICFDIRFPEWSRLMMEENVDLIALPAAFARATGPRHFELLLRARALDNQCFVAGVAPAQSPYSHGHTTLASPDGRVIADLGEAERLEVVALPMDELALLRSSIPISAARRLDLYQLTKKSMW